MHGSEVKAAESTERAIHCLRTIIETYVLTRQLCFSHKTVRQAERHGDPGHYGISELFRPVVIASQGLLADIVIASPRYCVPTSHSSALDYHDPCPSYLALAGFRQSQSLEFLAYDLDYHLSSRLASLAIQVQRKQLRRTPLKLHVLQPGPTHVDEAHRLVRFNTTAVC